MEAGTDFVPEGEVDTTSIEIAIRIRAESDGSDRRRTMVYRLNTE